MFSCFPCKYNAQVVDSCSKTITTCSLEVEVKAKCENTSMSAGASACAGVDAMGRARHASRRGEQHDRQEVHLSLRQQLLARVLPWLLAEVNRACGGRLARPRCQTFSLKQIRYMC